MYAPRIIRRRFHWPTAFMVTGVFAALVGSAIFGLHTIMNQSPLPPAIRQQITFPVFIPTSGISLDQLSYKFVADQKVLSFTGRLTDGQHITFTEQPTPPPFNDIPNYTTQFLQTLFEYQAFDSLQGTVHLTHPKGAGQAAVMNAKGTLMFARVDNDEPQSAWQSLFNSMVIYTR